MNLKEALEAEIYTATLSAKESHSFMKDSYPDGFQDGYLEGLKAALKLHLELSFVAF